MARTRFIDYRANDSTELLNNFLRGILEAGVYLGFNVTNGSSLGLWLKFTHDTDPDNTGEKLGVLLTHDGVVIQENEDQDNVVQGSVFGGTPNIHYVVASYTYNKALPNNDVVYAIKQGTSGSPPTPPGLTDDEVLLAEIYLPSGATGYDSSGVDIKTVAKKTLYDINVFNLFSKFEDILDPGIYDGMEMSEGSTNLKVHLSAGTWITNESFRIVESSNQSDLFTLTNPGNDSYRFAWIVGLHKAEDLDPEPDVDYLLVEGTPAAIGSQATLPSDSDLDTAAEAVDEKYDDPVYINKLGYIRCENRSGTYYINYYKGTTVLDPQTITVYGAEASSLNRSGRYYGHQGLVEAIDDIYAITSIREDIQRSPYTIRLDGVFKLDDTYLTIPSHVKLVGVGASARIESDEGSEGVLRAVGFSATYDTVNNTVAQSSWSGETPPSGYVGRTFEIDTNYRSGEDLVARKFSKGDRLVVTDMTGGTPGNTYEAEFRSYDTGSNNWTINVFIQDQYNTDGNPLPLNLYIYKQNIHIENVDVGQKTTTGDGVLYVSHVDRLRLDRIRTRELYLSNTFDSNIGLLEVENDVTWTYNTRYHCQRLVLECPQSSVTIGSSDAEFDIGSIEYTNESQAVTLTFQGGYGRLGRVVIHQGADGSDVNLNVDNCFVQHVENKATNGDVVVNQSTEAIFGRIDAPNGNLSFSASANNSIIMSASIGSGKAFTNSGSPVNKLLHLDRSLDSDDVSLLEQPNSDRNLHIVSDANVTWNATTGELTWSSALRFDNPWTSGYTEVSSGSETLSTGGDRLYVDIDRGATGTTAATVYVRAKASASSDRFYKDRCFIAVRYGDNIYLFDGTRIEDGQTVKIGSTPPPDGSVTYPKLASSALAFHNKFFRNYVTPEDNVGWNDTVTFFNSSGVTFTYTSSTGMIQYASSVDLSEVSPGDRIILRETDFDPTSSGSRALTWEEIVSIDDLNNRVYIAKGLDPTVGSSNKWNGTIFHGNKVMKNDNGSGSPVSFSYDASNGRVTYSSAMGFNATMIRPGFLFVDSAGEKYVIQAVDSSGNYVDVDSRGRDLDTTTPTTSDQGSIEMNNNPHYLYFDDLKVYGGIEFVPIDGYGPIVTEKDTLLRQTLGGEAGLIGHTCYPTPYDPRIRIGFTSTSRSEGESEISDNATDAINRMFYGYLGFTSVEITAVCTGAILVCAGGPASGSYYTYVDGHKNANYGVQLPTENFDNVYGMVVNHYEPLLNPNATAPNCYLRPVIALNLGIHHFMWDIPLNTAVRGIILLYAPHIANQNKVISDGPGRAIMDGGVFVSDAMTRATQLPTPSATWNKGGRIVRYIDSDGNHQFASQWVRTIEGTGDVANGSTDIQNVSNIDDWRTGDLIMIIGGTTKYLHRIDSFPSADTIRLANSYGGSTDTGVTLYYYGQSVNSNQRRNYEEVAASYNIREFVFPGTLTSNKGIANERTVAKTGNMGGRLSDLTTGFAASSGMDHRDGGGIRVDAAGNKVRIMFVGTGLSIERYSYSSASVTVTIDGIDNDTIDDGDDHNDVGGTFVCGELPYGTHIAEFTFSANETVIRGCTIWQSKKPEITGNYLELLDTNVLGDSQADMSVDVADGPDEVQFGTIQMDALSQINHDSTNDVLKDLWWSALTDSVCGVTTDFSGNTASGDAFHLCFFGDEITLVTSGIDVNSGTIETRFLDHDGRFKVPSSITGFTVSGIDSWTSNTTTKGERHRWKLGEMGFHVLQIIPTSGYGAQDLNIDSIEVNSTLHTNRTKLPVGIDHFIPWQFSGMDVRNKTPFRADYLPGVSRPHAQGQQYQVGTTRAHGNQYPFLFYTRGGLVEISVSFTLSSSDATAVSVEIIVDGYSEMQGMVDDLPSTGDDTAISLSRVIMLEPGFHFAYVDVSAGTDSVGLTSWKMRDLTSPATDVPTRGLGQDMQGPCNHHESSL